MKKTDSTKKTAQSSVHDTDKATHQQKKTLTNTAKEKVKVDKSKSKTPDSLPKNTIQESKTSEKVKDDKSKEKIQDSLPKNAIQESKSSEKAKDDKSKEKIQDSLPKNAIQENQIKETIQENLPKEVEQENTLKETQINASSATPQQTEDSNNNDLQSALNDDIKPKEMEYMSDTSAAMLMKTPKGARLLIYMTSLALISLLIWAYFSAIDEITKGSGKVIPSSRVQVIQNLEGGILKKLMVHEGQRIKKNQTLLQLDDTRFLSNSRETDFEYYSELAKLDRLRAELDNKKIVFSPKLKEYQEYKTKELRIYNERKTGLTAKKNIALKQVSQEKHALTASKAKLKFLTKSLSLGQQELNLTKPLAENGVVSNVEMIQLRQKINELASQRKMIELEIPKLQSAYEEAILRKNDIQTEFRKEVSEQLQETTVKLDQTNESQKNLQDQVKRTIVRSPVEGIVKTIHINTVGGVIRPGMDLMEIVPVEDNLLIETEINPKDVGFLRAGMPAIVKLTAYDFAIYGGLKGKIEHISADTVENKKGDSFYIVQIRTHQNYIGTQKKRLEIIPGMRTDVDIITGKKTLLDYLLKPILKAKRNALTER